jgi:hypothetical protein
MVFLASTGRRDPALPGLFNNSRSVSALQASDGVGIARYGEKGDTCRGDRDLAGRCRVAGEWGQLAIGVELKLGAVKLDARGEQLVGAERVAL